VSLTKFYKQKHVWTKCPGDPAIKCTWVTVPLDYSHPQSSTIRLRVAMRPASIKKGVLGDIFTNPGGPGASGLDVAYGAIDYLPTTITRHYNVVGIDPRGVGLSSPIHCLSLAQLDTFNGFGTLRSPAGPLSGLPTTPAQVTAYDSMVKAFGKSCKAKNPKLYNQVGTLNAARDMDIVRIVLRQKKLTYYGWSYGTYLGAWYAELFPQNVARFVLDGPMDPALDETTGAYNQMKAFENELHRFLADCRHHSDCPTVLKGTGDAPLKAFLAASNKLIAHPAITSLSRKAFGQQALTQNLFLTAVFGMLPDDASGWSLLRLALGDLIAHKDPTAMLNLAYYEDNKDPTTKKYGDNLIEAYVSILCSDYQAPLSVSDPSNEILATWSHDFPAFGSSFAWEQQVCHYWPAHTPLKPRALHAKGSKPILVVGATYDPATPYSGAVALSKELQHARLLTWTADGHTSYNRGSKCVDSAITTYLMKGTLPPVGKVCAAVKRP
jgi:pimeloyl-ACP methyl ester carboxylesterase